MFSKAVFSVKIREKQQQHELNVTQFLKSAPSKLDPLLTDEKIDEKVFYQKLKGLAEKWYGQYASIGDCDGHRLMNNTFVRELGNPLFAATVVDRLDVFVKSFRTQKPSPDFSLHWLEVACICGAEKIASYMLGQTDHALWLASPDIVPYALSSGNGVLTMDIARLMHAVSGTNPRYLHIYSFGEFKLVSQIEALFSIATLPQKNC